MSSENNPSSPSNSSTPLLSPTRGSPSRIIRRAPSLRGAGRFLTSSRAMREASVRVRESAAEQIEERQSDWAYSKPIVVLDLVWNIAFVIVSMSVLIMSRNESPSMPLRLWIVGYAIQCVLHMVCLCMEYKKRTNWDSQHLGQVRYPDRSHENLTSSGSDDAGPEEYVFSERGQSDDETSVARHLESANTMFSFIWWLVGFYWVSAGGQSLPGDAPQLYWLSITFLAFDVFFVVVCVAVACIIGIAVCCCLPCIIAILYAVADQEGATKEDIGRLPRYRFRKIGDFEKRNGEIQESFGGIMTECDTDSPTEHVLSPEDAECCICLCIYDDGAELRELPCCHHFHSACIDKWLRLNATCPLCKFNILKIGNHNGIGSEEV